MVKKKNAEMAILRFCKIYDNVSGFCLVLPVVYS